MTFPRVCFSEPFSPVKWPQGPQDYYCTWARQESKTEGLLIRNCRYFKINLFKTLSKVVFISGTFLI